jgi:hypothetical protein
VPLQLYFKDGRAKVEIAVAKGKKAYDKRHALRERQDKRDVDRALFTAEAMADDRCVCRGAAGAGLVSSSLAVGRRRRGPGSRFLSWPSAARGDDLGSRGGHPSAAGLCARQPTTRPSRYRRRPIAVNEDGSVDVDADH